MITLNIKGLKSPIKKWLDGLQTNKKRKQKKTQKNKTQLYAGAKRLISALRDTQRLKLKGGKKIFHANGKDSRGGYTYIKQNRF